MAAAGVVTYCRTPTPIRRILYRYGLLLLIKQSKLWPLSRPHPTHVGVKSRRQQRSKDTFSRSSRQFHGSIFGYSLRSYTFPAYFYSPLKLMFMTMDLRLQMECRTGKTNTNKQVTADDASCVVASSLVKSLQLSRQHHRNHTHHT